MRLFKLRHKPTGLYYRNSRYDKTENLSERGEIYHIKPSLAFAHEARHNAIKIPKEDWEVREFEALEVYSDIYEALIHATEYMREDCDKDYHKEWFFYHFKRYAQYGNEDFIKRWNSSLGMLE